MAEYHDVGGPSKLLGIRAIDAQVALFVGAQTALVAPCQGLIEGPGKRSGHVGRMLRKKRELSIHAFQARRAPEDGRGRSATASRGGSCHEARR